MKPTAYRQQATEKKLTPFFPPPTVGRDGRGGEMLSAVGCRLSALKAFSLVEVLMAVAILGLIAAIIVPRFGKQAAQSNIAKTKANLETLRTAIRLFYEQEGAWPMPDLSNLTVTMPSGMKYLPAIPREGITNSNVVVNIPDYSGGWYWDTTLHELYPNLPGLDAEGNPYSSY